MTITGQPSPLKVSCNPYERSRCYIETVKDTITTIPAFISLTNQFCQQVSTADIFSIPTQKLFSMLLVIVKHYNSHGFVFKTFKVTHGPRVTAVESKTRYEGLTRAMTWIDYCGFSDDAWLNTNVASQQIDCCSQLSSSFQASRHGIPFETSVTVHILITQHTFPPRRSVIRRSGPIL
jgi:hypothetical protein